MIPAGFDPAALSARGMQRAGLDERGDLRAEAFAEFVEAGTADAMRRGKEGYMLAVEAAARRYVAATSEEIRATYARMAETASAGRPRAARRRIEREAQGMAARSIRRLEANVSRFLREERQREAAKDLDGAANKLATADDEFSRMIAEALED